MWKRLLGALSLVAVGAFLYRLYLAWQIQRLKSRFMEEVRSAEARLATANPKVALIEAQKDPRVQATREALDRAEVQADLLKDAKEWADINKIAGI